MKITIRENFEATIQDQLDEQQISKLPINAKRINFVFYHQGDEESDYYQQARVEALLYNLYDWGIIDDETIETNSSLVYDASGDYRVEITIVA